MTFNFNKKCVQCKNMTIKRCVNCFEPLCGNCKTKKPRGFPGTESYLPAGVCKSCLKKWDIKMINMGYNEAEKLAKKYIAFINK